MGTRKDSSPRENFFQNQSRCFARACTFTININNRINQMNLPLQSDPTSVIFMAAVDTYILIGLAIYVAITMDWQKSKEENK
jgi:hypothetical protein